MDMQKPGPRGRSSSINPGPGAAVECKTPGVAPAGGVMLKLSTILALFSKKSNGLQKINDLVGYEMQCLFASRNSPKCHSRKNLNC